MKIKIRWCMEKEYCKALKYLDNLISFNFLNDFSKSWRKDKKIIPYEIYICICNLFYLLIYFLYCYDVNHSFFRDASPIIEHPV